ncbi:predicted protein [Sclerotinia sclerotiorum 1980 UF-70]|uniref:STEEP1 domain-containing protein n=2 Tax=Sclerotinia sclerotiorum (strain ATCC 18683 / 1980 / Ss-1) TaxID=665079 RepID=A0A1D9QFZ0_SCLS1|nr:predicted protein [Sclerotinia sclerotiorum 1980 UF-70]APA13845.1 hypothetical protein sscle_11g086150 [Sclerotinia sclerotiorum 1980 UF-70]EDN99086.1 predicted protein [Sclerotinia sclerotiorum 1980 UF-70]
MSPPVVNTYHCTFCTNLLLATTHRISTLPTRKGRAGQRDGDGDGDGSFILPVSGIVPRFMDAGDAMDIIEDGEGSSAGGREEGEEGVGGVGGNGEDEKEDEPLPTYGYTTLLGLAQPNKQIIIRREDGFEKRGLWRCGRCAVVVGYEVFGEEKGKGVGGKADGDGEREGDDGFEGMVLYLLRGALMSTGVMGDGKDGNDGMRITELDAGVLGSGMGVWE